MAETPEPEGLHLPEADAGAAPQLRVVAQYVKDLSFENYNAPQSVVQPGEVPQIEVNANLEARTVGTMLYEVDLSLTARAQRGDERLFLVEVVYGGLFRIENVQDSAIRAVCLIECPRLLFPFARRVIADATRDGGFQPLLVDPIDFYRLYRERYLTAQADGGEAAAPPPTD